MSIKILLAVVSGLVLTGCASTSDRLDAKDSASLSASPAAVVFRPAEYSVAQMGDASGEATSTTILGFIHMGDSEQGGLLTLLGVHGSDPLEGEAAYRAASSKGGDAFYQLESHTQTSGIPFIYSTKTVDVTGKVLKLNYDGTLSVERTDKLKLAGRLP